MGPDAEACGQDGIAAEIGFECAAEVNLAGRSEAEARSMLVAQTARFSASFLRWMETRTCDGINYARLRLLQALHCSGPAIMRDLGEQLGATPRNMTALVDALEDAQLVVRRPHPTDRRATLIELSEAGIQAAEQALEPRLDAMADLFAALSAAEREQFSALIDKLTRAMEPGRGNC
jgi:DNA-binding MarR family transcriptional regulator